MYSFILKSKTASILVQKWWLDAILQLSTSYISHIATSRKGLFPPKFLTYSINILSMDFILPNSYRWWARNCFTSFQKIPSPTQKLLQKAELLKSYSLKKKCFLTIEELRLIMKTQDTILTSHWQQIHQNSSGHKNKL